MNQAQKELLLKTLSNNKHELTLGDFSSLMSAYKALFDLEIMPEKPKSQMQENPVKKASE